MCQTYENCPFYFLKNVSRNWRKINVSNRMGDEIAIPLLVAEEKDALIKSLTAKASEIASLKASLVSDLSNIVASLNSGWCKFV